MSQNSGGSFRGRRFFVARRERPSGFLGVFPDGEGVEVAKGNKKGGFCVAGWSEGHVREQITAKMCPGMAA